MRTTVDTVPTPLLVLVVVGLVVGIVLLGVWAVRRFVPSTRDGFDAEVSSQMMGVVASLFGLLLAFVVVIQLRRRQRPERGGRSRRDRARQLRVRPGRQPDPNGYL